MFKCPFYADVPDSIWRTAGFILLKSQIFIDSLDVFFVLLLYIRIMIKLFWSSVDSIRTFISTKKGTKTSTSSKTNTNTIAKGEEIISLMFKIEVKYWKVELIKTWKIIKSEMHEFLCQVYSAYRTLKYLKRQVDGRLCWMWPVSYLTINYIKMCFAKNSVRNLNFIHSLQ